MRIPVIVPDFKTPAISCDSEFDLNGFEQNVESAVCLFHLNSGNYRYNECLKRRQMDSNEQRLLCERIKKMLRLILI